MGRLQQAQARELQRIADRDGILRPEAVVDAAKNKKNPLHTRFEWDDTEAGHRYRIWQARQIINVQVVQLPHTETVSRVYVSLPRDRDEGGYRAVVDVLNDDELREEMLSAALADANRWRSKYRDLKELSRVFDEIDLVLLFAKV